MDLHAGSALELVEVLSASANQSAMLWGRHCDTKDDAVSEIDYDFLKLGLDLPNQLRFTAEMNFVRWLSLARAVDDVSVFA